MDLNPVYSLGQEWPPLGVNQHDTKEIMMMMSHDDVAQPRSDLLLDGVEPLLLIWLL